MIEVFGYTILAIIIGFIGLMILAGVIMAVMAIGTVVMLPFAALRYNKENV